MPGRTYSIKWVIDDSQPKGVHKAALGQSRALEAQYVKTLKVLESLTAASARASQAATAGAAAATAGAAAATANGHAKALASSKATTAAVMNGHAAAAQAAKSSANGQVQALNGVAAAARKAATAVGFVTQAPAGSGLKTVMADLSKLHASLAKDKSYYVAPGGAGAKPGAYANVTTFLDKARREGTAVEQPRVGISGGEAYVDDGRTRLARLKQLGVKHFPVSVPEESAAEFQAKFGAAEVAAARLARAAQLRAERAARQAAMVPPTPPGAGVGIAAAGAEDRGPKVDVGYYKVVADQANREIALEKRKAAEIKGIHDKAHMDEYAAGVKRARTQEAQAERDAAAAVKRAERQAAAVERLEAGPAGKRATFRRRELSEEQVHANALNSITDVRNKRRIEGTAKVMGEERLSFGEAIHSALNLESSFGKVAIAGAAIGGSLMLIKGTLSAVSDGYEKIRADAEAAAEATNAMRKGLRMEAVLKGAETTDNKALKEALTLRATTGLGEQEASDLTRQYLGSLPAGLQKGNITPAIAKELMTQVGIVQARQGGDAGTRGDLAGLLGQFAKVKSVEHGLGQLEAIRMGLTEGRGDDPILTRQLLKTAGSIVKKGGSVGSLAELSALVGVTSLTAGPEEAGTRAEQLNRALKAGLTKQSKAKGAVMPQGKFLKGLGIGENDSLEAALDKLVPDLRKAQAAGRNADVYLSERGFRSYEERRAIVEVAENYDVLKERFKKAREAQDGAKQLAANQRFLESAMGRKGIAEQLGAVETATAGIPNERFLALTEAAKVSPAVRMGDQSIATRVFGDFFRGLAAGNVPFVTDKGVAAAGREDRVRAQALSDLESRAAKAGVSPAERLGALRQSYGAPNFEAEYTNRVEEMIAKRGGSLGVDIKPSMDRLATAIERANKLNEAQQRPQPAPGPQPVIRLDGPRNGPLRH